jgi:hypothetical protein
MSGKRPDSLNGMGPDSTSQKMNAPWSETQRLTSTIFLETVTMVRCSKKIKTERRTIVFALSHEWRQRRLAIAGLVLVKEYECISCGFGALCAKQAFQADAGDDAPFPDFS